MTAETSRAQAGPAGKTAGQAAAGWPVGFMFGVASSSYQVEGAVAEDGRTPSVWDTFAARPGAVADASDGSVACDFYHRVDEDVALLGGLGADAYRFSIAWSRVMPAAGAVESRGLDFYERVVDTLLEAGIAPVVNLFHWDHPQWLEDLGGWRSRETAARFGELADAVGRRLGDRVAMWSTCNEMFEHFALGHVLGEHAPGLTLPLEEAAGVAHHLMLGHGTALAALRAVTTRPVIVINSYAPARPASGSEADAAVAGLYDLLQNRLFTDTLLYGEYPAEVAPLFAPYVVEGDLELISAPVDGIGVNYYTVNAVRAVEGPVPLEVVPPEGYRQTPFGWAVVPEGLTEILTRLATDHGDSLPPLYVTENGCSSVSGADDPDRVAYLSSHLDAVRAALAAGVDVRGYYVWTLMDNFEWAAGYTQRFGLVAVDRDTLARTPRTSYGWYRDAIAAVRESQTEA
jgi:beta-glucosidase